MLALLAALIHKARDRHEVTERPLEEITLGQHGNRLRMCLGVCSGEPNRVQVRSDVALRRRCALDFENRTRVPQEFRVAHKAFFGNLDTEIQAQPFDIGTAHPHNLREYIFAHRGYLIPRKALRAA